MEYETFRFFPVIYSRDVGGTPVPVISPIWVAENIEDIKTIYAQVGVKIDPYPVQVITPKLEVVLMYGNYCRYCRIYSTY